MQSTDKRHPTYEDTDKMEFGKYAGEPLADVPVFYLRWCWENILESFHKRVVREEEFNQLSKYGQQRCKLANYIWNNQDALKLEDKDWIL